MGAEGPLFFLLARFPPEAPSDEKELPKGPPDSTEEDPELPPPPPPHERMARSSKHVRGPLGGRQGTPKATERVL